MQGGTGGARGGTGGRVFDTARGIYFTAATQRQGPGQPRKHNMRGDGGRKGGGQLICKGVCWFGFFFFPFFFPLLLAPFARLKTTQQHTRPTRLYPKKKKKSSNSHKSGPPAPLALSPGERPVAPSHTGPERGAPTPCHTGSGGLTGTPSWGAASRPCRPPGSPAPLPDVAAVVALARFALLFLAFLARFLRLLLLLVLPAHAAAEVARKPRCFICEGQRFRGGAGAAAPSPRAGSPRSSHRSRGCRARGCPSARPRAGPRTSTRRRPARTVPAGSSHPHRSWE